MEVFWAKIELDMVYVKPDCRRQGVGKELVKELLGLCSSPVSGCDMVTASYTSKENYPPDTCVWICALGTVTSDIIKNMLGENPPVFGYAVTRVSQM